MINILIRTHRRPHGFARLLESIKSQKYTDYRIIVSADDEFTLSYVKKAGIKDYVYIDVNELPLYFGAAPIAMYNMYFNRLISMVDDGYIYCMDDDDFFYDENSLSVIASNMEEDTLCIFKMSIWGGIIPSKSWGKQVTICDIGTPCFCVHSKYAKQVKWGYKYTADGEYIRDLSYIVPNIKWVDKVVYIVPKSNAGKGEI